MSPPQQLAVVVDTDVYTLLFVRRDSPDPRVAGWRKQLVGRRVAVAFQTRAEVLALASANDWGDRQVEALRLQLGRTATIGVDDSVVDAYAALVAECRRSGHPLHQKHHTGDRWIAACAIAKGMELVAGDGIFDGAPGLRLMTGASDA